MPGDMSWMKARFDELSEQSLLWEPPTLEGPNQPRCQMDGKPTIMLSANNYLNLTTHPKVTAAMRDATSKYGAGSGSVRAIAGTMDIHLEAERKVAEFKGVEASLIYSAGYTVNVGLIPTLVTGPNDVIISDALNHGSIIDGVRLTKASRAVYGHNDMGELEAVLKAHESSQRKLIITDGVFSMDGDIAPLDEVTALAEEYGAMVYVDDCHGEGVLGEGGAGIVDHFKLQGKVDFETGSFSKALGVQGGILAGTEMTRTHALNHSRSWLLSGSQPPGVAAAQKAAIDKMAFDMAHDLKPFNICSLSLWSGIVKDEKTQKVSEQHGEQYAEFLKGAASQEYAGMVINEIYQDSEIMNFSGSTLIAAEIGDKYGIKDIDSNSPQSDRESLGGPRKYSDTIIY